MDVTSASATGPAQRTLQEAGPPDRAASALSSDFETFLRMLTAQMENQDPLNPLDSSDFAVQLATFSGVEQQVRTNDLLTSLVGQLGTSGMSDLAVWIGKDVRSSGAAYFDGTPITLYPETFAGAESARLVVKDPTGRVVDTGIIDAGKDPVIWAGVDEDGRPFLEGSYTFEIESLSGEDLLGTTAAEHYATVEEVRKGSGGAVLVLRGGRELAAADVLAVRSAKAE